MKSIFSTLTIKKLFTTELPSLMIAILLAENFYKFGSFSLELIGFMATWVVLSKLGEMIFAPKGGKSMEG